MALNPNLRSFTFNLTDLNFIAAQIAFKPLFYKSSVSNTGFSPIINWDGTGAVYDSTGALLWDGVNGTQFADSAAALAALGTSYNSYTDISGLRDVTGNYNNLLPGQSTWGATNQDFTRIAAADFKNYVQQAINIAQSTSDSITTTSADSALSPHSISVPIGSVDQFGVYTQTGTFSVTYNTFKRTVTVTDITTTDNHHNTVNNNQVTTTTTTQAFMLDGAGEHAGAITTANATDSFLSGGELDTSINPLTGKSYHAGLAGKIAAATADGLAMNDYNPNKSVVDYTPRMISETITTAGHVTYDSKGHYIKGDGVVLLHDAHNQLVYWDGSAAMAAKLKDYSFDGTKTIDTASLVLGSAIVDTTVPLLAGQADGSGNPAVGTGDGNIYSGAGYGELSIFGQHDKQNTDANNVTGHGNHEYFYGNVASIGGNAPNNGFMALFGQFFDHGLDFVGKSDTNAAGHTVTITIPLAVNDPLYGQIGSDGQPTTSITINRATVDNHWVRDAAGNLLDGSDLAHSILNADGTAAVDALGAAVSTAGADGIWGTADDIKSIGADHTLASATLGATSPTYINHTSPYIDQSQTYGSVADVTSILREWVEDPNNPGTFIPGTKLLDGHQTVAYANPWAGTAGQPDTITNTLPTLNELRAAVVGTNRTALTWEDVSQDVRHRDANGHVALYDNSGTQVAYLDKNGTQLDMSGNASVEIGLHTNSGGDPLLLDMNPHVDGAHLTSPAALAAVATLNASLSMFGPGNSFSIVDGVVTLVIAPGLPGAGTYTGVSALSPWVNFADFSIQKGFFGGPGPLLTDAQHAAIGEILLDSVGDHYIAGDGRANENFGLTSIHQVFHEEHSYQVQNIENTIRSLDAQATAKDSTNDHGAGDGVATDVNHKILHDWQTAVLAKSGDVPSGGALLVGDHYEDADHNYTDSHGNTSWNLDKVFNGAKLTVEMEYQHSAVDQYARAVSPDIQEFAGVSTNKNAAITLEYGQAAFRFGHSTLRDTIDTMDPTQGITSKIMSYALENAFLNPAGFSKVGAGAVLLGSSHQLMNEVDQFVTPSLNEGLLAQPLDLGAINIARGRDMGLPTLNAFKAAAGIGTVYNSWNDFKTNMIHPERLVDFVAAYSLDGDLDKAQTIIDLNDPTVTLSATEKAIATANGWDSAFAHRFLSGDKTADTADGVNHIDIWIGGLAEVHVAGGILGETFNAIFVNQIENLMDGDRLYYLQRLVNQDFGSEMQNEQLKDIVERTTGLQNLNGNIFTYADNYYDEGRHARLATEALKDPTSLTDLYTHDASGNATIALHVDPTGHAYVESAIPTGPLFDLWGNQVVDLYDKAHNKVFDSATLQWTSAAIVAGSPVVVHSFVEPTNFATDLNALYFADGTYVGGPQNKYASLIGEFAGSTFVNPLIADTTVVGAAAAALDVTNALNHHANTTDGMIDNGLGTDVSNQTGLGIYTGDDVTTAHNGAIAAHHIMLTFGDESTAPLLDPSGFDAAKTISFNETYINDARPTGSTTNLDGSVDKGTNAAEVLVGTANDDYIQMGIGDDTAYGGKGNDIIYGGLANAGHNTIYGGDGNDFLVGGDAPDLIDGGNGDDWIFGQSSGSSVNGVDQLIGGAGNDHIFGGIGIDKMFGGQGDDYLYGGSDTDPFMYGGDGNDYMNGNSGQDILFGGNGSDIMDGGAGQDNLYGGNGDDILRPGDIADVAGNGGGSDVLIGGDGTTNPDGSTTDTGFDFADYSQTTHSLGLVGDLANQAAPGALANDKTPLPVGTPVATNTGDVWLEMEGIIGTKNNDHLMGDSVGDPDAAVSHGNNWLIGGSGSDILEGRGGNDVIIGGSIRLDSLIGTYARTDVNHLGESAYHSANDYSVNSEGASHRIWDDATLQSNGLLDAAALATGQTFAKHLGVLEQSLAYKDYVLGDTAGLTNGGTDTAVFTGNFADYKFAAINNFNDAHGTHIAALTVTDNGSATRTASDGTDLLVGISKVQFADGTIDANLLGNSPPAFTSAAAFSINENTTAVTAVVAVDPIAVDPITYSIVSTANGGAADAALFTINATTGALAFASAPNFEAPAHANNIDNVTIQATDLAGAYNRQTIAVTVNNVNEAPVITSAATASIAENNAAVMTVAANDPDAGTVITYSISTAAGSGVDGSLFNIDASTGALSFKVAPNFELPAHANNIYNVTVLATDNGLGGVGPTLSTSQDIAVTVTNVDEIGAGTLVLGVPGADGTLTTVSTVTDPDLVTAANLAGTATLSYQWQSSGDGGATWTTIPGATGASYLPTGLIASTPRVVEAVGTYTDAFGSHSFTTGTAEVGTNPTVIFGFSIGGNDTLAGTAGADLLIGLGGNDTYVVNNVGDVVVEAVNGGTDLVRTSLSSYTLTANVENLTYTGTGNFTGTGNALNNTITGGNAAGEIDTAVFTGNAWQSTAALRTGFTVANATDGTDTLVGIEKVQFGNGTYNLVLGTNGNDSLNRGGDTANDFIVAGRGNDTITGGAGDDVIVWSATGTTNANAVLDGLDIVNGGSTASARGNTFVVNGNSQAETYDVYSGTAWGNAGNAGSIASHIYITRNGVEIADVNNIQELQFNMGGAVTTVGTNTTIGTDHVITHGSFGLTTLNYNTISVDDQGLGAVTVDVTDQTSAHHIALYSTNAADTIIGARSQDQIITGSAPTTGTGTGTSGTGTGGTGTGGTGGSTSGTDDSNPPLTDHICSDPISDTSSGHAADAGAGTTAPVVAPTPPVDQHLLGDATANNLNAGDGNNTITGLAGDDLISAGNGNNNVIAGDGNDTVVLGNGNNHVDTGLGNDNVFLGNGNNLVDAGAGDNNVFGGSGHTTFVDSGLGGNNSYHGDGASDTLDMSAVAANIQANLGTGFAGWAKAGTETDHLYGIENISTGSGDDTVTASDAHNIIDVGDHSIGGHDTIIFRSAAAADGDTIQNFQTGDVIDLHGMMGGTVNLKPNGTATANHDLAVQYDATTHGDSVVTGLDDGGNHFELLVKGHHVNGTDFAA